LGGAWAVATALRAGVVTAAIGAGLFVTGASAVAWAAAVTGAFGSATSGVAGRAGLLESLELVGGQDPGEFVLHFLFEGGNLFALIIGEVEFAFDKARDDVDAAGRAGAVGATFARASGATPVFARWGRGGAGAIGGPGESDQR
jgi:hypothetical protein